MTERDGEDQEIVDHVTETENGEGRLPGEGINAAGSDGVDTGGQVGTTIREPAAAGENLGTTIGEPAPTGEDVGTTVRDEGQPAEESGTAVRATYPDEL